MLLTLIIATVMFLKKSPCAVIGVGALLLLAFDSLCYLLTASAYYIST